ncbi:hypothetical protein D3C72_1844020 [compost metagenome]
MLAEECLHRPPRQLYAQHAVPLPGQPGQVQALAAQRHQHAAARRQAKRWPILLQIGVHLRLVKADLVVGPPLLPERWLHDHSRFLDGLSVKVGLDFDL